MKIFSGYWSLKDLRENKNLLFLFGDNLQGWGKRGQAIIRDEPNAFGIPTKKRPSTNSDAFLTDKEFDQNKQMFDRVFDQLKIEMKDLC